MSARGTRRLPAALGGNNARAGGPGGRTIGTKRTLLVEILGLTIALRADSARPHDVIAARELLWDRIGDLRACARLWATSPTGA